MCWMLCSQCWGAVSLSLPLQHMHRASQRVSKPLPNVMMDTWPRGKCVGKNASGVRIIWESEPLMSDIFLSHLSPKLKYGSRETSWKGRKNEAEWKEIETLVEVGAQSGTESFQSCFYCVSAPSVITVGTEGVTGTASWAVLVVPLPQDFCIPWHFGGFCVYLVKPTSDFWKQQK